MEFGKYRQDWESVEQEMKATSSQQESHLPKPSGTPMTNTLKVQIITITALGE